MLQTAVFILLLCYALACAWLCWQWWKIPVRPVSIQSLPANFRLSVVIPVRNEAAHIGALLEDLVKQTLPKHAFEVIVVNDASTDDTVQIVRHFQRRNNLHLTLIDLPEIAHTSPKKRAITEALQVASGLLIVTTDGDCRVGEEWLASIAHTYLQTGAKLISGPVVLDGNGSNEPLSVIDWVFRWFQTIEFSSLIGTGACLLEAGTPTMCNGANLAYERAAFEAVGGYAGVEHLASGDDEFLLQKIAQRFPGQIYFLKNGKAVVSTQPQPSWRLFYRQRVRWASKWAVNRRVATMLAAVFVFLVNVVTLGLFFAFIFRDVAEPSLVLLMLLKCGPEFVFLALMMQFFRKKTLIFAIPLIQIVYPLYVLFFGLAAQQKGYEWKGRRLK
ncbi:MAG: glycosyltransferase [Spirosomaceae bacterium]|jgi:cellulose synthase/poly-beta-1,6-N-acetylglucosamine synthase-like glycosyltransferase|nr:glycosyltransferase [Spirosomataceae bacterium]